jgi:hypothetical protein
MLTHSLRSNKPVSEYYFNYPTKALFKDYMQSLLGAAIFSTPLIVAWSNPYVATILGAIVLMFLSFGFATWRRHKSSILVTDEAIGSVGARVIKMPWDRIDRVDLRYFSTRREKGRLAVGDEKGGWMQMKLHCEGAILRIDSSIQDFDKLSSFVAEALKSSQVQMSPVTMENFSALGLTVGPALENED